MSESQVIDLLIQYFKTYGYFVIFTALLLENLFLLGLVIPGETVLLLGAVFSAQNTLNIVYVIITAIIAATVGNIAGYFVGRKGGRPLIEKFGGRFISPEKIKQAEKYFDQHGTKTVFIGRFAAGLRTFIPLLAGAAKMNFGKFLIYTITAIIMWTLGLGLIGFFFGESWPLVKRIFGRFTILILVVIVILVILYIIRRRREEAAN